MEDFDYVKHASKEDVDRFFFELEQERKKKYSKSLNLLNNYKYQILSEFELIKSTYCRNAAEYPVKVAKFYEEIDRLKSGKLCVCGGDLRLIDGSFGEFWGCSNYRDETVRHENYMHDRQPWVPFNKPSVIGWAASIRSRLSLPRSLPTGCIYHFVLNNGYEDISELYHGYSEINSIYKIVDTRKKATKFELEQFELLKPKLNKVSFQLAVKYKLNGNRTEKLAFPDIVGSDDKTVYIYECKTNKSDVDIYQKELYIGLITRLLFDAGINKKVVFEYLFENQ
jgi:ssDNA-binding Zn-finger/Zn-ribbon topoisomerase 1